MKPFTEGLIRRFAFPILLLLTSLTLATNALSNDLIAARVISVTDGDNLTVIGPDNKQVLIRLHGLDCPELAQPFGENAKEFTSNLCFGKIILYRMLGIIDTVQGMTIKTHEEYSRWYSIDIEFHETIAEAASHQRLKRMLDILRDKILFMRRWVLVPIMMDDTRQITVEEHEAVWEKLCQGDSNGAGQQMAEHLERGERRTLERIRK